MTNSPSSGRKGRVGDLLRASPPLAARLPVVVDSPCYTHGQLAAIFGTLAAEAGFSLSPAAAHKAAAVLARVEGGGGAGNARLAVQLLDRATVNQARRITATSELAVLTTITVAEITADLDPPDLSAGVWPGQYL